MQKLGTCCGLILLAVTCAVGCKSQKDAASAKSVYDKNVREPNGLTLGPVKVGDASKSVTLVSCGSLMQYDSLTQAVIGKSAQAVEALLKATNTGCDVLTKDSSGTISHYDDSSLKSLHSQLFMKLTSICEKEADLVGCDGTLSSQIDAMLDSELNHGYYVRAYITLLRRGVIAVATGVDPEAKTGQK